MIRTFLVEEGMFREPLMKKLLVEGLNVVKVVDPSENEGRYVAAHAVYCLLVVEPGDQTAVVKAERIEIKGSERLIYSKIYCCGRG